MHFNRVKNGLGWWPWEGEASKRQGWCVGLLRLVAVPITASVPRTGGPASMGSRLQRVKTRENDDLGHRTDLYLPWLDTVTWNGAWDGGAETETVSIIVTYGHKQGSFYKRECWVPKHLPENFRLLSTWVVSHDNKQLGEKNGSLCHSGISITSYPRNRSPPLIFI